MQILLFLRHKRQREEKGLFNVYTSETFSIEKYKVALELDVTANRFSSEKPLNF